MIMVVMLGRYAGCLAAGEVCFVIFVIIGLVFIQWPFHLRRYHLTAMRGRYAGCWAVGEVGFVIFCFVEVCVRCRWLRCVVALFSALAVIFSFGGRCWRRPPSHFISFVIFFVLYWRGACAPLEVQEGVMFIPPLEAGGGDVGANCPMVGCALWQDFGGGQLGVFIWQSCGHDGRYSAGTSCGVLRSIRQATSCDGLRCIWKRHIRLVRGRIWRSVL